MTYQPSIPPIPRLLRWYYFALALVAVCALGGYALLQATTTAQVQSAALMNLSSRQRMFSQYIAYLATHLVAASDPAQQGALRAELRTAIEAMEQVHDELVHGSATDSTILPSPARVARYAAGTPSLDARVHRYLHHARTLSNTPVATLSATNNDLLAIQVQRAELLAALEREVLQVERESTTLIRTQHISEGVVLVVVLSVLGSGALLIIRPITQRAIQAYASLAHAEAALRVSEQRYRTLVTSLHEGVVLQHHDGSIQACNPSAEQMLGLTSDQLVGRTSIDPRWRAVREDGSDFPGDEHPAMVALRTGKPSRGEIMGVHKSDDTVTWLTVNAQPLFQPEAQTPYAVVTSFFDITEQRRIEQEVRYQKTLLECLCEASLDGILVVSPDRRWLYLNQRFASMWNFSDEVVAAASSAIGLPAMLEQVVDSARARARIEAIYANIHPSGQEELHLHDGRIFERYSAPVLHGDGTFYGRVWYYRDVTEREAVARAKRAFVSAVSHELRTPLTAIHFAIGMINSGKAGDVSEQMRPIIAIVYNNSERLIRLINDILDSEKFEISAVSFVLAPVALVPLVQQALDANRHYAASFDVSLVLEPVAAEIWVNVDSDRLMQVLTNLLSNAAKFSPFGGVVTTAISTYDNTVRIAVTDQGPGIPPEFQPRIFEKFAQADDPTSWRKGGTGLGLNIARSIIERLGGTIGFTTSTNGTTFFVELPIWREPMPTRYLAEHKACIA